MTSTRGTTSGRLPGPVAASRGSISARLDADTRVLVVEDEHDIADFLRAFFRASGYDLVHLDPVGADELLDAARHHQPDCILLDVRLRGFSGIDAYRRLRDDPTFAFVPIVLVTADATASLRAVGLAEGIDGFVGKPFSVHALETLVRARVARARELAQRGADPLGVAPPDELQSRLIDEVRVAELGRQSLSFALLAPAPDADLGELVADARRTLPASATVGRTTGGEVAVILPQLAADAAAARLTPLVASGSRAGVAGFPADAGTADELYMAADVALSGSSHDEPVALAG